MSIVLNLMRFDGTVDERTVRAGLSLGSREASACAEAFRGQVTPIGDKPAL
jgi:hypothetical protein